MINFDEYVNQLVNGGWPHINHIIGDHLQNKGFGLSNVLFLKAVLKETLEGEDGPLSGYEPLKADAYEVLIIGKVLNRLIDEHLL